MTTIAWDGTTLAADKQSTSYELGRTVTKIHRVADGLLGFTGSGTHAAALLAWFQGARDPALWPRAASAEEAANAIHVTRGAVFVYNGAALPYGERLEDRRLAFGSGRDYALAAMHLGQDAVQAVTLAALFDINTGKGVDALPLEETA